MAKTNFDNKENFVTQKSDLKGEFDLEGLACTNCAIKIEEEINKLPGVDKVELNFATGTLNVSGDKESTPDLGKEIQAIADRIEPGVIVREKTGSNKNREYNGVNRDNNKQGSSNTGKLRLGIGSLIFFLALVLFEIPGFQKGLPDWSEFIVYGISYFLVGGPVLKAAYKNIGRGQIFDENFLMTVATIGAFTIKEYPEGVAVMLFYMIGELFQDNAVDKSRRSIKSLMDIRPDYANLITGGNISQISPEEVAVGSNIIVKPGEKVPLDGEVVEGSSMVDTSALTGESIPKKVEPGDTILSGMINQDGLITIRVTKEYSDSTVARILDLVENASSKKAPTEKFITKFARYYTPIVVYTALALAIIPPLVIPGALFSDWVYRALIFLVISCPCALVVSIPLGFFGGIGQASRQGILVKGGNYLEALNQIDRVVFDKTGTLTRGVFKVDKVNAANGFDKEELLKYAALAESHSNHPIARSIIEAYGEKINKDIIESYQEISGYGIKAVVQGKVVIIGNSKLLDRESIGYISVKEPGTVVYVAIDGLFAGYITISDEIKEDSISAINGLKEKGIMKLLMLTGDREEVAANVAGSLGLNGYYAGLLPDEKVKKVEELLAATSNKGKLAFIGDGINDAPVLARSDIGVAMGGLGSDAAIEAADIVLMTDEPSKLVTAINVARRTKKIVWQNIFLALGVKGIVLLFGAFGHASMWEAVFADVGVALLAVFNSMRILRNKEGQHGKQ